MTVWPRVCQVNEDQWLAQGDQAFAGHKFIASVTMPAYLSGIFRVRLPVFLLGAVASGDSRRHGRVMDERPVLPQVLKAVIDGTGWPASFLEATAAAR